MVKKQANPIATKADTDALARRLDSHDQRFDLIDARFDKSDGVQKNLAIEMINLRTEIGAVEERLIAQIKKFENYFATTLDRAVSRMETFWRETATVPLALDRFDAALADHERRITSLENRPAR